MHKLFTIHQYKNIFKCLNSFHLQDLPYYARRLQLGPSGGRSSGVSSRQDPSLLGKGGLGTASLERGATRHLRGGLLDDLRSGAVAGAPHPSPTKGLPALSLLDINPAGTGPKPCRMSRN